MSDRSGDETRGLLALGAAIRTQRAEADLSRDELADRAGVSSQLVAEIEAGRQEPTWGDLRRIAHGLGTPLEQLLELAERLEKGCPSPPRPDEA